MLHTIESDTPFEVVFLEFWVPVDIPYKDGCRKILKCLDCMIGFGVVASIGLKGIISKQAAQSAFGNFFVPFGIPKMIVVDADGLFLECSRILSKRPYYSQYMQLQGANKSQL